ncbi:protein PFF0380w-like [Papilio machaon]|uniref:protein PFF0380w-like n=1 Tax=Papilio machaon TaxID=76193 RepID=UPI001E6640AB|nr:protein PFF0380w-like [Papilio machaon]
MIIKKLPTDIQSLLSASSKINNYKNAVEELVYNSLDADATSVAVRIHIYENVIQVIDNGFGIAKCDIPLLGQRYASSKVTEKSAIKSAPIKFGFRGESLSNIIEVSQCVKITTRHKDAGETWVKSFYNGQHKDSKITSMRPSKGTTVEIKGFLYNLHIQKKATNPLNELQNIKLFLQQLSLVNTNVSISLRDNSKNEIIYKVHKNRDVYQTLTSLYEIDKKDLQELQIEKHQYKAKGFISKQNSKSSYQWIYLNGRFINKSPLHDIINSNFTKNRPLCKNVKTKVKISNLYYSNYDINITSTKTIIEFKDWTQTRELLEKLVQFYKGDIKLKKLDVAQTERKNKIENTREEVRKIIEKVLGNKSKGHKISQLRKGVKGKIVKKKKNPNSSSIKRFKNLHKMVNKSKETGHNLNVPENLSSVIEAPISMNFQELGKNAQTDNDHNLKKLIKSNKDKQKNKSKLKIEQLIQQDEKRNKINTHTNKLELEEAGHISKSKENFTSGVEDTTKDNFLHITRNKMTPLKNKAFKRKKDMRKIVTQEIDPIVKRYMQETAFEIYSEKLTKKKNNMNEVRLNTLHVSDTKMNTSLLQSEGNIHSFYEHKLAFNGVTPLNKLETEYLKSSDLLKTIINSQKVGNFFNKPFEEHNYYGKVHHQKLKLPSQRRNNINIVNDTGDRNIDQMPDINYSYYINNQNDHLRKIQECFEKKYSDIESMANIQNECELTSNFDQFYKYNKRIKHVNNISTAHVYKSFPKLTFESHKHYLNDAMMRNNKNLKHFISKQSKENFNLHNNQHTYVNSNKYKSCINQLYNNRNKRKNSHKYPYLEPIKTVPYFEHKSSHTIEFSTNNMYNVKQNPTKQIDQWKYKITGNVQNTYTILDSNVSLDIASYLNNLNKNTIRHQESVASCLRFNFSSANDLIEKERHHDPIVTQNLEENNLEEIMLNSEMPAFHFSQKLDSQIEPIDLCKAVYQNNDHHHKEVNYFNIDKENEIKDSVNLTTRKNIRHDYSNSSCYKNDVMSRYFNSIENMRNLSLNDYHNLSNIEQNNKGKEPRNQMEENQNDNCYIVGKADNLPHDNEKETTHHFRTVQNNQPLPIAKSNNVFSSEEFNKERNVEENQSNGDSNLVPNIRRIENESNIIEVENNDLIIEEQNMDIENLNNYNQITHNDIEIVEVNNERMLNIRNNEKLKISENFILQSRHSFVPKGMSPIFENCNSKNVCSYNLEKDYFQDELYNNFANDVLENIKIYENKVSNMNEVSKKINKDPNCLKFDTQSLKNAKVFGQVDRKFIVAELKSDNLNMKHLVLFDQHAVHERIRLEENLSDYKDFNQWNSVNCEKISIKLSKDHVLYLNNFKDKFQQLGLDWKIENESLITINAVPKAIFGKYCRQADVIMQSIKNLIIEEIKAIKTQGGNTLSYPKSIMDLVFSEACRYAIKFGDKLSKRECATLISSLSSCRIPFQCAHGRPVLAVLSDLKTYDNEYKVLFPKINAYKEFVESFTFL